ncbi:hypothetical protein F441_17020 [Phytophthora nicotianae CJ01A1]|uniref:Uncharacterized protein n=5 Tax=Phytophthora nicotianae TaxID=4792 RepID=W2PPB6_PHYN3|nr:hypothetical protein PPTG_23949 [Phytophthora nicotianae INRA-310]ETI36805.1 hypothetical protein F443_17146 [Phytophthora nicotianae P1569]ETO65525.1 hypothetical protein F444_17188 [Phytophthora nicotianae P1976]ETP06628.1 hypothetical protein F441_17020 [Phytophthora nicotianae CJ01A1]ETP34712.1 hypothetical protein F442_17021 [Phytophthora nicotianae P10297]ETN02109.1 hypothetical protein PPTG_23949 [Phytophthora nicotianae INRA-310]
MDATSPRCEGQCLRGGPTTVAMLSMIEMILCFR